MDNLPEGVSTERRAQQRGWYGEFKTWWRREQKTTNGKKVIEVLIAAFVLGISGGFIVTLINNSAEASKAREVANIRYDAEFAAYQNDVTDYQAAVAANALCADSVGRSDANREAWEGLADLVESLGGPVAADAATAIRTNPVLSIPPRKLEDCPSIPPKPTPPTREDS